MVDEPIDDSDSFKLPEFENSDFDWFDDISDYVDNGLFAELDSKRVDELVGTIENIAKSMEELQDMLAKFRDAYEAEIVEKNRLLEKALGVLHGTKNVLQGVAIAGYTIEQVDDVVSDIKEHLKPKDQSCQS